MDIKSYISSGILELYVLGQLPPAETAEVEALAEKHPEIRQEIFEISKTMEMYSKIHAIPVDPALKNEIFKNLPPKTNPSSTQNNVPSKDENKKSGFGKLGLWMISLLSLLFAAYMFFDNQKINREIGSLQKVIQNCDSLQQKEVEKSRIYAKMTNPETKVFELASTPTFENSKLLLYYNSIDKTNTLQWVNAPELEPGKVYQLWYFAEDGVPKPLETFTAEKNIWEISYQDEAAVYAFTIEPEGGSTTPTLENLIGTVSLQ